MYSRKPLYQPWNEDAFQSSYFTRAMTPVQRWMYKSLLTSAFFHSTAPYLPDNDKVLSKLAGCESFEQWLQNKEAVLEPFDVRVNGMIGHQRVIDDWNRVLEAREKMAELGRKSADVRRTFAGKKGKEVSKESEVKRSEVTTLNLRSTGAAPSLDDYIEERSCVGSQED